MRSLVAVNINKIDQDY